MVIIEIWFYLLLLMSCFFSSSPGGSPFGAQRRLHTIPVQEPRFDPLHLRRPAFSKAWHRVHPMTQDRRDSHIPARLPTPNMQSCHSSSLSVVDAQRPRLFEAASFGFHQVQLEQISRFHYRELPWPRPRPKGREKGRERSERPDTRERKSKI